VTLAVGDDWQSINRFAGADLSVMTNFASWFGEGPTLRLQTTFRSPQSICDTASAFVADNPRQVKKTVASIQLKHGPLPSLVRIAATSEVPGALSMVLPGLAARIGSGEIAPGPSGANVAADIESSVLRGHQSAGFESVIRGRCSRRPSMA
jgi:DNA helicase IV